MVFRGVRNVTDFQFGNGAGEQARVVVSASSNAKPSSFGQMREDPLVAQSLRLRTVENPARVPDREP